MNNIFTNSIVDPNIGQPFTGPSLKFLQNATSEMLEGLVASIASTPYTNGSPIALYGMQKVFISGTTYQFGNGYVFLNNEICIYSGTSAINISQTPILKVTSVADPIADPLLFSDNVFRNVHMIRRLSLTDGALNSGDANYVDLVFINSGATVNVWSAVTYAGLYADYGVGTNNSRFRIDNKVVRLDGAFYNLTGSTSGTKVFTLPAGYTPSAAKNFSIPLVSGMGTTSGNYNLAANGDLYVYFTGTAPTIFSLDGITFRID